MALAMHITHVALWTPDLDRARAFYETWFGASAGPLYVSRSRPFQSYFLTFASGARLELMTAPDVGGSCGGRAGWAHIALSVGSVAAVDALTDRMRAAGVPVTSGPRTTGDGYYESTVLDPDGNTIEITV